MASLNKRVVYYGCGGLLALGVALLGYERLEPLVIQGPVRGPTAIETSPTHSDVVDVVHPIQPPEKVPLPPAELGDAAALPALPDSGLPLADQLDALATRASAGDPVAACRLVTMSARCVARASSRDFSARLEKSLARSEASGPDELFIRAIAQGEEAGGAEADDCDGLDVTQLPSPDTFLGRAASNMTPRQKVALAMMRPDGSLARLPREPSTEIRQGSGGDAIVPQFFADHDLEFLQVGYSAADPLALEGLILIHAPGRLPGSTDGMRIELPNPYEFALYSQLMQRLYGDQSLGLPVEDMMERTMRGMSPGTLAALNEDIERRLLQWLSNGAADPSNLGSTKGMSAVSLCD